IALGVLPNLVDVVITFYPALFVGRQAGSGLQLTNLRHDLVRQVMERGQWLALKLFRASAESLGIPGPTSRQFAIPDAKTGGGDCQIFGFEGMDDLTLAWITGEDSDGDTTSQIIDARL